MKFGHVLVSAREPEGGGWAPGDGTYKYIAELDKTILDSTEQMLHSVVLKKIGSVQVQIVLL